MFSVFRFAFLVIAGAIGWEGWKMSQREKHNGEQQAMAAEFSKFTGVKSPPPDAADDAKTRYRKGHLLLINSKSGAVDRNILHPAGKPASRQCE